MTLRLLGLFLALAAPLLAQSAVWKVTCGGQTLYLGGTIHVLRESDFPLPPEFDAAFAASRRVIFETDLGRMRSGEMQLTIAEQGLFSDGRTLDGVLAPAVWQAALRHATRLGLPAETLRQMKPWLFAITVTLLELQQHGIASEGVDLHYYHAATAAGKPTGELETFERHLGYIVNFGAGLDNEIVRKSLEDLDELPRIITPLLAAWRAGDLPKLETLLLREARQKFPATFKKLLTERNLAWLPQLEHMLQTPEVEFVLVGAGHLSGRDGLLALLRSRGCRVEQLTTRPAGTPAPRRK